ncbi:MAG: class I SAM-dependent methyltransferase [Oliverpabstia sp.]
MYNEKDIISKWNSEMYDCNETDTNDVEFALSVIGIEPKHILEIACGSGRFLVPMANAGHNVTGLDFDEHMLNRIATKISGNQNIRWHKSDVINDEWENGFDIVLLVANFLSNIVSDMDYEQAQELMIKKSADALVSGGYVLIDYAYTFYPEKWFNNPNPNIVWQGTDSEGNSGKMVLLNNTYDTETGIAKCTRRFEMTLVDGSSLIQEIPTEKHFATIEQVREWLKRSGFVIENEWGDYQGNPISENTSRAIIWAKKM